MKQKTLIHTWKLLDQFLYDVYNKNKLGDD